MQDTCTESSVAAIDKPAQLLHPIICSMNIDCSASDILLGTEKIEKKITIKLTA
jgi:hypothetical protein